MGRDRLVGSSESLCARRLDESAGACHQEERSLHLARGGLLLAAALYVVSTLDYLLFHSVAEIFSIAVAFAAFTVFWNARRLMAHDYLLLIGIGFPFIAVIDLIHTLAYRGMGIMPFTGSNVATQLWIAARGLEAIMLVVASIFLKRRLNIALTMSVYLLDHRAARRLHRLVADFPGLLRRGRRSHAL